MRRKVKQLFAAMLCLVLLFSLGTNVQAETVPSESNNYETDDTLQSNYPGEDVYEASWLLGKFNTVTWNGGPAFCHLVGPVLSQGPVSASGGFSNYTNGVSSYLAGTGHKVQSDTTNIYREPTVPFPILYIGKDNKPIRFVGNYLWTSPVTSIYLQTKDYDENNNSLTGIYSTDGYVNWVDISRALIAESSNLCAEAKKDIDNNDTKVWHITMDMVQNTPALTNHRPGHFGVDIPIGKTVYVDPGVVNYMTAKGLHFYLVGDFESDKTTLINIPDAGAVKMPGVIVYDSGLYDPEYKDATNQTAIQSSELGSIYGYAAKNGTVDYDENGTSIVWNMNNATQVTYGNGTEGFGHLFAPNAYVDGNSGSYNGGFICQSVNMPMTEIHMFPMKGSLVPKKPEDPNAPPFPIELTIPIQKNLHFGTIDGPLIPEMVKGAYKFTLQGISENAKDINISVYNDIDGKTSFDPIVFDPGEDATYKFKLWEEKPSEEDGTIYDSTIYYITVDIKVIDVEGVPTYDLTSTITKEDGSGTSGQAEAENIEFDNVIKEKTPTSASVQLIKKLVDEKGDPYRMNDYNFSFTLKGTDDSDAKGQAFTATSPLDGYTLFAPIEYTKEGEYIYTLKENKTTLKEDKTDAPDIEDDTTVYYVVVNVVDNQGALAATVTYYKNEISEASKVDKLQDVVFTNTRIKPEPTSATIELNKRFIDEAGNDVDMIPFKFVLYKDNKVVKEATVDTTTKKATFTVDYDEPGVYTYTILETDMTNTSEIIYDTTNTNTVTVDVKNSSDNKLYVDSVVYNTKDGKIPTFVNTKKEKEPPVPTSTDIKVNKVFEKADGTELAMKAFEFELVKDGQVIDTQKINTTTKAAIFHLDYTEAGVYDYIVREKVGTDSQIDYDTATYSVKVVVELNQSGNDLRIANVSYKDASGNTIQNGADGLNFTNTKKAPAPTSATIELNKEYVDLNNVTLPMEEFEFSLSKDGTVLQTAKVNTATNKATFTPITYTKAGTYVYTVKEVPGSDTDIDYSADEYTVTVEVTEDEAANKLVATVSYEGGKVPTFVNKNKKQMIPKPTGIEIPLTKTYKDINGNDLTMEAFQFDLMEGDTIVKTVSVDADGEATFKVNYTEAGEHTYTIKEKAGSNPQIIYDTKEYTVIVKVEDVNDELVATVTYEDDVTEIAFENTKKDPIEVDLYMLKELRRGSTTGEKEALTAKQFSFYLYEDEDPDPIAVTEIHEDGKAWFGSFEYDTVGTETYKIKEVIPKNKGDIIYDETVYEVTINVKENAAGDGLVAEVTYSDGTNTSTDYAKFINVREIVEPADAEVTLSVNKELHLDKVDGTKEDLEGNEFSFTLYDEDGVVIDTVSNDANGEAAFKKLNFNAEGTYIYTVKEVIPAEKGDITYDETVYTVTVEVTKDANENKYNAVTTYTVKDADGTEKTATELKFINVKDIPKDLGSIDVPFKVTKELRKGSQTGETENVTDKQFSFELYDEDGKLLETVSNDAEGKASFAAVTLKEVKKYTYKIKEVIPTDQGDIVYDGTEYTVTVDVKENTTGDGLVADVTYKTGTYESKDAALFVNVRTTVDPKETSFELNKILYKNNIGGNKVALEKDEFEFILKGMAATEGTMDTSKTELHAKNGTDGKAAFSITHNEEGTYVYTLTEIDKSGTDNSTKYDTREYTVTIVVTKVGNELQSTLTITDKDGKVVDSSKGEVVFENVRIEDPGTTEATTETTTEKTTEKPTTEEKTTEEKKPDKDKDDDKTSSSDKKDDKTSSSDKKDDKTSSTVKTDNSAKTADTASIFLGFTLLISAAGACVVLEVLRRRNNKKEE